MSILVTEKKETKKKSMHIFNIYVCTPLVRLQVRVKLNYSWIRKDGNIAAHLLSYLTGPLSCCGGTDSAHSVSFKNIFTLVPGEISRESLFGSFVLHRDLNCATGARMTRRRGMGGQEVNSNKNQNPRSNYVPELRMERPTHVQTVSGSDRFQLQTIAFDLSFGKKLAMVERPARAEVAQCQRNLGMGQADLINRSFIHRSADATPCKTGHVLKNLQNSCKQTHEIVMELELPLAQCCLVRNNGQFLHHYDPVPVLRGNAPAHHRFPLSCRRIFSV